MNPIFLKDFYKVNHYEQYPSGTTLVFSNFTPRHSLIENCNHAILFGVKYLLKKYLIDDFNNNFFNNPTAPFEYKKFMKETLGVEKDFKHIYDLHKLGYLPIEMYSLPEITEIPISVPALVIFNTLPDYYWVPNMLETLISCVVWGGSNSATIAHLYRKLLDKYAQISSDNISFVDYQAHDFSFRGLFGIEAAILSGAAHLQYFKGTDTIPAIHMLHDYYNKDYSCGTSVPATEHSVMSSGSKEKEFETYKRLITEIYPSGIISIVSDTWDLWNVIDNYLPLLKNEIMNRDGKVVIRPDSGDPVSILCGIDGSHGRIKGVIERLWDIFGGIINRKGYKELDPHIGAIYGDSITLDICNKICEKLNQLGFSSTNVVFGIGSYTYQYNTRDTLGWAMKATYCEINGSGKPITKNPKTDNGIKKSHSGILKVVKVNDKYKVLQNQNWDQFYEKDNELKLIYKNGKLYC